ncbi:aaa-type atpase family protein-related [Anaeramoeba flamelloides]|uniref:Aaa-type atpase family protein-related n=1 Tax=Anaeramoeba flamelloides TaxID=1746091 RepID=A0AAV8AII0_9EUKA|nr:aaa-type atpase family protein-related [Anaeramoeba flamelloides]
MDPNQRKRKQQSNAPPKKQKKKRMNEEEGNTQTTNFQQKEVNNQNPVSNNPRRSPLKKKKKKSKRIVFPLPTNGKPVDQKLKKPLNQQKQKLPNNKQSNSFNQRNANQQQKQKTTTKTKTTTTTSQKNSFQNTNATYNQKYMRRSVNVPSRFWGYIFHQVGFRGKLGLEVNPFSIGNASKCHLQLKGTNVSGLLARLVNEPNKGKFLEVHGDKGQVILNGKTIQKGHKMETKSGDHIIIGGNHKIEIIFITANFFQTLLSKKPSRASSLLTANHTELNASSNLNGNPDLKPKSMFQNNNIFNNNNYQQMNNLKRIQTCVEEYFKKLISNEIQNFQNLKNIPNLNKFEYPIDETLLNHLLLTFQVHFTKEIKKNLNLKKLPQNISNKILLTHPNGANLFQKKLCLLLAKYFKSQFLTFEPKRILEKFYLQYRDQKNIEKQEKSLNMDNKMIENTNQNKSTHNFTNKNLHFSNQSINQINKIINNKLKYTKTNPKKKSIFELNKNKNFSIGSRIRFIGPNFEKMDQFSIITRVKQRTGPKPGAIGTIKVIFNQNHNSSFVGVEFDNEIEQGGNDLGKVSTPKHGFFVKKKEIKLITDDTIDYHSLLMNSFIQYLISRNSDFDQVPFIIFFPNIEKTIFHSLSVYYNFTNNLTQISKTINPTVIIAGYTQNYDNCFNNYGDNNNNNNQQNSQIFKNPNSNNLINNQSHLNPQQNQQYHNNNLLRNQNKSPQQQQQLLSNHNNNEGITDERDLISAQTIFYLLNKLFPNKITVKTPIHSMHLEKWRERIKHDNKMIIIEKNIQLLNSLLEEFKVSIQNIDQNLFSTQIYSLSTMKNIFQTAFLFCMRQLKLDNNNNNNTINMFNGKEKNSIIISEESLLYAINLQKQISQKNDFLEYKIKIQTDNEYEERLINEVIPPNRINIKFSDIGNLNKVKKVLLEYVILPLKRPELFQRGNLIKPCKGILLFGPPGTGKTMLAKAIATESGAHFLNISMSTISSKWFGEGEKIAKAVFTLASKLSPSIIFIDEVDSLLNRRGKSGEHETSRKIKNTFMEQWDGLTRRDDDRVIVLAATNRPHDLDEAVLRRFPRRMFVDLPNLEAREKILKIILKDEELQDNFDFHYLAAITEGYSGSDLKNLAITAGYFPIRELLEKEKEKERERERERGFGMGKERGRENLKMDLNNNHYDKSREIEKENKELSFLQKSKEKTFKNSQKNPINLRKLTLNDFVKAKKKVKISVSQDSFSLKELTDWNKLYGEGGQVEPQYSFYYN